jgi:hypothetical protein
MGKKEETKNRIGSRAEDTGSSVVECLPSAQKALSSNPRTTKKKKKR